MRKALYVMLCLLMSLSVVLVNSASAGEKEDLAIKAITLQEEVTALQKTFNEKQKTFQELKGKVKVETDYKKKGEMALEAMQLEEELFALMEKHNKKEEDRQKAKAAFKAIVDKEITKK